VIDAGLRRGVCEDYTGAATPRAAVTVTTAALAPGHTC